ncbi:hypothetical protein [Cellulomonas sp. URHB0016]
MRQPSMTVRRAAVAVVALVAALALVAPPASATSSHFIWIRGLAQCDPVADQWLVTWELTSSADVPGTIGNVRAYPAGRPLVGMPNRIQPGETIRGEQRLLSSEYTGEIIFDVNWDDGLVTYDHHWPVYIFVRCGA